jgi:hypothetical protein
MLLTDEMGNAGDHGSESIVEDCDVVRQVNLGGF